MSFKNSSSQNFDHLVVNKTLSIPKVSVLSPQPDTAHLSFSNGNLFVSSGNAWTQLSGGGSPAPITPEISGNVVLTTTNFNSSLSLQYYKIGDYVTFRLIGSSITSNIATSYDTGAVLPLLIIPQIPAVFFTSQSTPAPPFAANVIAIVLRNDGSCIIRKNNGDPFQAGEEITFSVASPQFSYRPALF